MTTAAVIGVGAMGQHHARVYNEMEDVQLVAVADPDPVRRAAAERRFGVPAFADHTVLLAELRPELVSVVVPSVHHHAVTMAALAHGVHVLVEKPIAGTLAEAEEILAEAEARGLLLTVGHVERFNPAVMELKRRLDAGDLGRIFHLQARRLSPFPAYVRDVGVVIDLATHELDIFRYLLGGQPVERVFAETGRNVHERYEDMLFASLRFANGVLGVLDINWLTPTKIRELRITGERGMFLVDYLNQDLYFYENSIAPSQWDAMALFKGVEEGNVMKIRVAKSEPLRGELRAFVDAVATGAPLVVTGLDGLQALVLAKALLRSAAEGLVVRGDSGN